MAPEPLTRKRVPRSRTGTKTTTPARSPTKPAPFAFEEQVYLISHLTRLINARAEGMLAKSGIRFTYPQASVLIRLLRTPGISAAEMARISDVRPQTVLKLLSLLYKNKLVESRRDPAHGRIRRLHLTARGFEVAQECDAVSSAIFAKLTESIPESHLQQFRIYLLDAIVLLQNALGRRKKPQ